MQSGDAPAYDVIAERAPVGLLVLDADGVIEWTNDEYAALLDTPRDDLVGTPFPDLVDAGYYEQAIIDQWTAAVKALLSSRTDTERENYTVRTHVDGNTLVHDVSTTLKPLEDGEFTGTVHAFRDVTTQKDYERELERQNERLDEFAAVVSHDLRNPLTVAVGFLERAREDGDTEAFEKVADAHQRMSDLIDDLLSLAHSSERVDETEHVDVAAVAHSAWRSVDTENATLVVEDIGHIDVDSARLRQLFENLFRNAIEHGSAPAETRENGGTGSAPGPAEVTVRVGATADGFFVEDDGNGIPEERKDHVFDRGYSTASGTGLGLAIADTIVDAHGWTIDVAESANGGARFEISTATELPL